MKAWNELLTRIARVVPHSAQEIENLAWARARTYGRSPLWHLMRMADELGIGAPVRGGQGR